jgi:hypothetical protein
MSGMISRATASPPGIGGTEAAVGTVLVVLVLVVAGSGVVVTGGSVLVVGASVVVAESRSSNWFSRLSCARAVSMPVANSW